MAIDRKAVKDKVASGFNIAKEKAGDLAVNAKAVAKDGMVLAREKAVDGREKLGEAKVEMDKRMYKPLSAEAIGEDSFLAPNMIRLLDKNPYEAKEACADAAGFDSVIARKQILQLVKGVYPADKFNFIPNLSEQIYLQNPYVENMYIALNEYFDYIKKARVAELEMIADKLGAKYAKITYKESEKKFVSVEAQGKKEKRAFKKNKDSVTAEVNVSSDSLQEMEVASENRFVGHDHATRPELVYFKGEGTIESLINSRMGENRQTGKTLTIKYSRKTDLNMDKAAEIDNVLAKLKLNASASVKSEVEKENRMFLEFKVEF